MSSGLQFRPVFKAITSLTVGCGIGMVVVGLLPVFSAGADKTPFIEPLFNTLSYIFASGVGVIFGALSFGNLVESEKPGSLAEEQAKD